MAGKGQLMTIILMSTVLLTGGIVPYSFANDDDYEYEDECEVPSEFSVMYEGPSNAKVEIYKKIKHAKNNERMLKDFTGQTFNSGDYIVLNALDDLDQDELNSRTVYKIMHGSSWEIISMRTDCKKPITVGDVHEKGGIKLTIIHGKDKHGDDVIYEEYHVERGNKVQECSGEDKILLDFESGLEHGSNQESIQAYLSLVGPDNFEIEYSADSRGPVNNPGAIYDSRNHGGADPDLEDPAPNPPDVGNMLIIQERDDGSDNDGVWNNPDDESSGGKHFLSFKDGQGQSIGVDILSWRNIDLEGGDEDNSVTVKFNDVSSDQTIGLKSTGNDKWTLQETSDFTGVKEIIYDLDSSGGITDICIQVPEAPILTGSITVQKVVVAEDPSISTFEFSLNTGESFTLGDGQTGIFSDLTPAAYVLSEDFVSVDFSVEISCEENGAEINPLTEGQVEIIIEAGDHPICEFTNIETNPATLTIKKALTNDNNGDATVNDFEVTIWDLDPDGLPETDDEVIFKQVSFDETTSSITESLPAGTYKITEAITDTTVVTSYTTVLFAGDTACPASEGSPFTLTDGQEITCIIYNDDDFVPGGSEGDPPTMKITVQVHNLEGVMPDQFEYEVGTEVMKKNGDTVNIPINTPVFFHQTNFIDTSDPDNPPILPTSIEGDGNCPDVIGTGGSQEGFVTLSANQNIECIVVYGVKADPGVIFHFNTMEFSFDDDLFGDSCDNIGLMPCIEMANTQDGTVLIVDPLIESDTTIFLFSVIEQGKINTPRIVGDMGVQASSPLCIFNGISPHDLEYALTPGMPGDVGENDNPVDNPSGELGFAFTCTLANPIGNYNVNYALIETVG